MATTVVARSQQKSDYAALAEQINGAGLLKKRPVAYYVPNAILIAGMSIISLSILVFANPLWILVAANAALAAIISAQLAYLGHDLGHQQIFSSPKWNNRAGLATSFAIGIFRSSWVEKHNSHHTNPNVEGEDPDLNIPLISFSEEQALKRRGFGRYLLRHQAWLLYPLICLEGFGLRLASFLYALRNPDKLKYGKREFMLFGAHILLYGGAVFLLLPPLQGMVFIMVHQIVFGFALGMAFAPNHKGMPILERGNDRGFLYGQAATARNIRGGLITDFLLGGLNYQIEHHLFSGMPRRNLGKAQKIVRAFCREHDIPYHATSFWRAQVEILSYLHQIGKFAQTPKGEA